jgi:hypothetical protein
MAATGRCSFGRLGAHPQFSTTAHQGQVGDQIVRHAGKSSPCLAQTIRGATLRNAGVRWSFSTSMPPSWSLSAKESAAATFKGSFGFHPSEVWCDNTTELLAARLSSGSAEAKTAADTSRSSRQRSPRSRDRTARTCW